MVRISVSIFLIALLMIGQAAAQSTSTADLYRSAAREVPAPQGAAEVAAVRDVFAAPLDSAVQTYLDRGIKALSLFDSASQLPMGDWGFAADDPTSGGRTLVGAEELSKLVTLRARWRCARGQYKPALEDCYNLAQLARRLSVQPSLVRQQQQNLLFGVSMQTVALLLPQLPAADVEGFLKGLEGLRSPADPAEVVAGAKLSYLWYYTKLIENPGLRSLAARSEGALGGLVGIEHGPVNVRDLWMDPEQAQSVLAQASTTFDAILTALQRAPGDRQRAVDTIAQQMRDAHALVLGACEIANESLAMEKSQAVLADLAQIVAKICADPNWSADETAARQRAVPYEYESRPGGFTLTWKPPSGSEPVILQVGPRTASTATTLPTNSGPLAPQ